ncbi:MAG: hypothetical protein QOI81_2159 [Actinomycetota bacterium]|jgi:hypothetical protein|nr:hypothetical protein [Actinomycetota bacterium]
MRRVGITGGVVLALLVLAPQAALASGRARAAERLPSPVACAGCWHPELNTSWQWQLGGTVDTSVDVQMYDIDGFENHAGIVGDLHTAGREVVCYISAGSWEKWRPDAGRFPDSVLGNSNGWPGERWLNISRLRVLAPIMRDRVQMCASRGYDAVEFDNVDGYQNHTGFPLTGGDQLKYDTFLANLAHTNGMSAVLKNDLGQIKTLLPYFDFALNEQCFQYNECGKLRPFVDAGKAVFGVEYKLDTSQFCPQANAMNFNFLKKKLALGSWRVACR